MVLGSRKSQSAPRSFLVFTPCKPLLCIGTFYTCTHDFLKQTTKTWILKNGCVLSEGVYFMNVLSRFFRPLSTRQLVHTHLPGCCIKFHCSAFSNLTNVGWTSIYINGHLLLIETIKRWYCRHVVRVPKGDVVLRLEIGDQSMSDFMPIN